MAYTGTLTAEDFNGLNRRINEECKRRDGKGPVDTLPDNSAYKYSWVPLASRIAMQEHFSKIVGKVSYIKTLSNPDLKNYKKIDSNSLNELSSEIGILENYGDNKGREDDVINGNTGCKSSCTGLCHDSCTGLCYDDCNIGCSGDCANNCVQGLRSSCNTCAASCYPSCALSCIGCGAYCGSACGEGCGNGCGNTIGSTTNYNL